jgi:hypothetical protein
VTVVGGFEVGGRDVPAHFVQPPVVEPVDVVECGDLDLLGGVPGSAGLDQLGFVQADDGLGQGIDAPISVKLPVDLASAGCAEGASGPTSPGRAGV